MDNQTTVDVILNETLKAASNQSTADNGDYHFFLVYPFLMNLIAGGCCGLAVDGILFPLDTWKTRLQSETGFWKSGAFRGLYNGILPVVAASVPIAASFFCIYELVRRLFPDINHIESVQTKFFVEFLINSLAASLGEMVADLIRTPIEIVKQKRQVNEIQHRATDILMHAYKSEGLIKGIYRGYGITLMRDIPFSMIQYPLWELLKALGKLVAGTEVSLFVGALFGSIAGGVASAITTPLDVAKTRIQLAESDPRMSYEEDVNRNPCHIWSTSYRKEGIAGICSGFVPRVTWTFIGGFIWFGTYSLVEYLLKMV